MWGRPSELDVVEMCNVWDAHLPSPHGSDPTLTDIRALDSIDLFAFNRLLRVFAERRAVWTALAGPQAILHRGGLAGAAILGALQLAGPGYRLRAFDSLDRALEWLGVPQIERDFEALSASLLDVADIVRRVQATLEAEPGSLSAAELSRKLGLSVRSLQRHLELAGTSLRKERTRHVVARAERLLEGTELDLGAIATMIGARSAGQLTALFQRVRGMTPGTFRRARVVKPAE